jgi:hypothetical protein
MIIQLDGTEAERVQEASRSLQALTQAWGHPATAALPAPAGTADDNGKVIDPISLAALVLSVPSAALAVLDLADRIRRRKRATELIEHARQLGQQQVIATLVIQQRAIELHTLTPDQLLDLADDETAAE